MRLNGQLSKSGISRTKLHEEEIGVKQPGDLITSDPKYPNFQPNIALFKCLNGFRMFEKMDVGKVSDRVFVHGC